MDKTAKERMKRYREKKRNENTTEGVTKGEGVTADVTVELFEGKPCYLVLSDEQVLDRANQPRPNKHLTAMIACNRANETDLSRGRSKARRIALIGRALDKEMTGLDDKRVKLSSMVRLGVSGLTFEEINSAIK